MLQIIVNVLDFGMNMQEAVDWPRFHHQWMPDELRMEPGFSPDTMAMLEARGHTVKRVNLAGRSARRSSSRRMAARRRRPPRRRHGERTLTHESRISPRTCS